MLDGRKLLKNSPIVNILVIFIIDGLCLGNSACHLIPLAITDNRMHRNMRATDRLPSLDRYPMIFPMSAMYIKAATIIIENSSLM